MPPFGQNTTFTHSDGYVAEFPEEQRCKARSTTSGKQCRKRAERHFKVCGAHGAGNAASKEKKARIDAMEAMRRFVTPINPTDPEANPIAAFEMEFRRCIARIRYYDEVLAALAPDNLGWGMTKSTEVGTGEYPGTDIEHAAQINIYEQLQFRERKHLMDMVKVWIGAKLDVRKLEVEEQKIDALNGVIEVVLTKLGHDIRNAEVKRTVRDAMLELPTAGQSIAASVSDIISSPRSLVAQAVKDARRKK